MVREYNCPQLENCAKKEAPDFSIAAPTQKLGSARKGEERKHIKRTKRLLSHTSFFRL